jgi:hypothetical protein
MHHKMAEVKSKKRESEKFFTFRRFVKFFSPWGVAGVVFGESRKRGLGWRENAARVWELEMGENAAGAWGGS